MTKGGEVQLSKLFHAAVDVKLLNEKLAMKQMRNKTE